MAGDTRWVRPPAPWRPSKLRLLVDAQRSPGSSRSAFMARHMEQPGSRHSNPAALKISCRPSRSACVFHQTRAWHDHGQLDVLGHFPAQLFHHGRGLAHVFDAAVGAGADEHLVDKDVVERLARLQRHVGERPLDRAALVRVFFFFGIGHAAVHAQHHFGRGAPGDLRHDAARVELHHGVKVRVGIRLQRLPVGDGLVPLHPVGRQRAALDVFDGLVVHRHQARRARRLRWPCCRPSCGLPCESARMALPPNSMV